MHSEFKKQTLVAAEFARQNGFEGTHHALLELLELVRQEELDLEKICPESNIDRL